MNLTAFLEQVSPLIEATLDQLIPEQQVPHGQLFQAARYSLLGGGKRLRPILTLVTAKTFGLGPSKALRAACAIEMIHTYSLIHDDLPCMDDDDFRRGKPSLHKAFPEGHAVLTGDYLLTFAFEVIATDPALTADQKVALIALLASHAGGDGMIGGQVMDIEAEGVSVDLEHLQLIHRYKTGAMIKASIEFGGILAGASEHQLRILRNFGEDIGLAFQIIDDVLDVTASVQKHGRAVASDTINQKTTYVTLLGLEKAQKTASELLDRGHKRLSALNFDTSLLQDLATRLVKRAS